MPEEIFVLFVLMIMSFFGLTMTSMILRHRRRNKEVKSAEGASMTTSDLEQIMRRAVEDATAPLATKIEDLEMEIVRMGQGAKQLAPHDPGTRITLEDSADEEVLDVQPVRAGRTRG